MTADWLRMCKSPDLFADGAHVDVTFSHGRRHRVTVTEWDEAFLLTGIVIRHAAAEVLASQIWLRNRALQLVGFRIDQKGRLVGEAWVPKLDLSKEEFRLYVRSVAAECDRFEYLLTGRDVE